MLLILYVQLLESGVASSVQEKFGSKMFALLREILLTKRLEVLEFCEMLL